MNEKTRIEKLEDSVAQLKELAAVQGKMLGLIELKLSCQDDSQAKINRSLFELISILKNGQTSIVRGLVNTSTILDDQTRQAFLDSVARLESNCEMIEKIITLLPDGHPPQPLPPASS